MTTRAQEHLLLFAAEDVNRLDLNTVVETQRQAFLALSRGTAQLGTRVLLPGPDDSVVFSYAARLDPAAMPVSKFGSVVPTNLTRGLPAVSALVVALDHETGRPRAIVNGDAVTEARTVAASLLAAETLAARTDQISVLGSGAQGRLHAIESINRLGPTRLTIWSPFDETAYDFARDLAHTTGVPVAVHDTVHGATHDADVVFACTTSKEPIVDRAAVRPGATVISIGSFAPDRAEIAPDLVQTAHLVVDHIPTAITQAGPIVRGIADGMTTEAHLHALGDVLAGTATGRASTDQTIYFNSVGVGIQDAAVVEALITAASQHGWGHEVAL